MPACSEPLLTRCCSCPSLLQAGHPDQLDQNQCEAGDGRCLASCCACGCRQGVAGLSLHPPSPCALPSGRPTGWAPAAPLCQPLLAQRPQTRVQPGGGPSVRRHCNRPDGGHQGGWHSRCRHLCVRQAAGTKAVLVQEKNPFGGRQSSCMHGGSADSRLSPPTLLLAVLPFRPHQVRWLHLQTLQLPA